MNPIELIDAQIAQHQKEIQVHGNGLREAQRQAEFHGQQIELRQGGVQALRQLRTALALQPTPPTAETAAAATPPAAN